MKSTFLLCVTLTLFTPLVTCYPHGPDLAVAGMCDHMVPGHSVPPQTEPPAFEVYVNTNCYRHDRPVPVYIRRVEESAQPYFEGLFVMARDVSGGLVNRTNNVGNFSWFNDAELKRQPCYNKSHSAVSQSNKNHWDCKRVLWYPSPQSTSDVQFHATIVRKLAIFWVDQFSTVMRYDSNCPDHELVTCFTDSVDDTHATTPRFPPVSGSDVIRAPFVMTLILAAMTTLW